MKRTSAPLVIAAAVFVAAGGVIHLREWLDSYRDLPSGVPGAAVVKVGFPVNAAVSAVVAVALVATLFTMRDRAVYVVFAAIAFQAVSLASLIISRTGSLFGWMEPVWTDGANQIRAVEIAALVALVASLAVSGRRRTAEPGLRASSAGPLAPPA
jgi:hypothetical protein